MWCRYRATDTFKRRQLSKIICQLDSKTLVPRAFGVTQIPSQRLEMEFRSEGASTSLWAPNNNMKHKKPTSTNPNSCDQIQASGYSDTVARLCLSRVVGAFLVVPT